MVWLPRGSGPISPRHAAARHHTGKPAANDILSMVDLSCTHYTVASQHMPRAAEHLSRIMHNVAGPGAHGEAA